MSLTVTHSAGARVIEHYRVLSDPAEYDLTGETNRSGKLVAMGDRGRRPAPLQVAVEIQEATFQESVSLAGRILGECRVATAVTTYRGTREVDGILEHALRSSGPVVTLVLYFNPSSGAYS